MNMRRSRSVVVLTLGLVVAAGACAGQADPPLDATDPPTEPDVTNEPPEGTEPGGPETTPPTTDAATTTPAVTDAPSTTLELVTPRPTTPTTAKPPAGSVPVGSDTAIYPGQIDPGLQPFVDMAIADLSGRLDVGPTAITVVSAVLVTWPDGSLGCPMPGMEYVQVLQDGSVIELGFGERVYRYHSGGNRTPFLCDQPLVTPPLAAGDPDA
jgi:hypothetical protein